jgi:uncharacterized protein (TIGR03790 family)
MRLLYTLLFAAAAFAQSIPLKDRVLILVNDRVPDSVSVGQYYAAKRNIPAANILHLKTAATEGISQDEFKDQIENPLRKFLDANGGAMRRKILYIVPTYGVPVAIGQQFAVDSVLVMMYAGHEDQKPPLRNPYSAPTGSRPPHFAEWSDGVAAANNFKMFVVTRLDGPSAAIAKGLVDKAILAESSLTTKSGIAYFDSQGTRHPDEWQYAIDMEVKAASELSRKMGFETVLNVQAGALCGANIPGPPQYLFDGSKHGIFVNALQSTASSSTRSAPPLPAPSRSRPFPRAISRFRWPTARFKTPATVSLSPWEVPRTRAVCASSTRSCPTGNGIPATKSCSKKPSTGWWPRASPYPLNATKN